VVALLERIDARSYVHHDARALVAEDHREQSLGIGARAGELVGVAHAAGPDLHEHLAGLRSVEVHRLDDEGLARLVGDGGTCLHVGSFGPGQGSPEA